MGKHWYNKNQDERKKCNDDLIFRRDYRNRMEKEQIIFAKYGSFEYQDPDKWHIRHNIYIKHFNMGKGSSVQNNIFIRCTHGILSSKFVCGRNVRIQRNVDIDYTGDLEIGNGVGILEGAKILTHSHDSLGIKGKYDKISSGGRRTYLSPLIIEDNVTIGSRAIIMPGVGRIGENSIISVGSVVRKRVPPNAVVAGNPAQIVTIFPADRRSHKRWKENK
jgi:acetyltransferase-like isoleucine patch superfamily enzyme